MDRRTAYNTVAPLIGAGGKFRSYLGMAGSAAAPAVDVAVTTLRLCAEAEMVAVGDNSARATALRALAAALAAPALR